MTVIGRHLYSEEMSIDRRYRPSTCDGCGAASLDEAGSLCKPQQLPSGEYACAGDETYNPFAVKWTIEGRACVLTNKSAKAEARFFDQMFEEELAPLTEAKP